MAEKSGFLVLSSNKGKVFKAGIFVLLLLATGWLISPASAYSPASRYSPKLRGTFAIDYFYFPGLGWHLAAVVCSLDDDSPLHEAGVEVGDIITRLDNYRVKDFRELERHYCWTLVRYYRPTCGYGKCLRMFERDCHIPH